MSQPAISDTTNRPNPPKAGPVKSLSIPPSVTPLLIPSHAPAQGPNRDTDGAPGNEIADFETSNGDDLPEQSESVAQAGGDILEASETPIVQISECGERRHGAGIVPTVAVPQMPLGQHHANLSLQRRSQVGAIPPFQLLPTVMEDAESSSSLDDVSGTPYQPTSPIPPIDENVLVSPGGGVESTPEPSHAFTFYRSDDSYAPRSHNFGSGHNAPRPYEPHVSTFHHNENEFARILTDSQWHEQVQARTSLGNAVVMQEASAAGAVQRQKQEDGWPLAWLEG